MVLTILTFILLNIFLLFLDFVYRNDIYQDLIYAIPNSKQDLDIQACQYTNFIQNWCIVLLQLCLTTVQAMSDPISELVP